VNVASELEKRPSDGKRRTVGSRHLLVPS
jgi:hypothetical protein